MDRRHERVEDAENVICAYTTVYQLLAQQRVQDARVHVLLLVYEIYRYKLFKYLVHHLRTLLQPLQVHKLRVIHRIGHAHHLLRLFHILRWPWWHHGCAELALPAAFHHLPARIHQKFLIHIYLQIGVVGALGHILHRKLLQHHSRAALRGANCTVDAVALHLDMPSAHIEIHLHRQPVGSLQLVILIDHTTQCLVHRVLKALLAQLHRTIDPIELYADQPYQSYGHDDDDRFYSILAQVRAKVCAHKSGVYRLTVFRNVPAPR